MKILLITDNHNPIGGGAEKYFFTLKSELQKRSGNTIYSMGFGPADREEKDAIILKETPLKNFTPMVAHVFESGEIFADPPRN